MRRDPLRLLLLLAALLSSNLVLAQVHPVGIPHSAPHEARPEVRIPETPMPHSIGLPNGHFDHPLHRSLKRPIPDTHAANTEAPGTHDPEAHTPHAHVSHEVEQNTGLDVSQLPFAIVLIGAVAFVVYLGKKQ